MVEDAGGVLSANNINRMKNATNTFIPGRFTHTGISIHIPSDPQ